jgi:hypothetical protein
MTDQTEIPEPGQIVAVRQLLYLVEQAVSPVSPGDSILIPLSCVNEDAQGQPLEVLWDRELDARIVTGEDWDSIASRGFDPPQRFAAYMNALRWNSVTSTDPNLLRSPFRAGICLDPYQLERSNLRVRMFLDVQRRQGDTSAASEFVGRFAPVRPSFPHDAVAGGLAPAGGVLRSKVSDGQRAFLPSLVAGRRNHGKRPKQIPHGLGRP